MEAAGEGGGEDRVRILTLEECGALQTLPPGYTSAETSKTRRLKMLANGFTVEVIAELLSGVQR